jgi:hypothetical protein
MWAISAAFIWHVLCSGKFDQMSRELDEERAQAEAGVEMGTVSNPTAPTHPGGVATAVMLPPEEANKFHQAANNV